MSASCSGISCTHLACMRKLRKFGRELELKRVKKTAAHLKKLETITEGVNSVKNGDDEYHWLVAYDIALEHFDWLVFVNDKKLTQTICNVCTHFANTVCEYF